MHLFPIILASGDDDLIKLVIVLVLMAIGGIGSLFKKSQQKQKQERNWQDILKSLPPRGPAQPQQPQASFPPQMPAPQRMSAPRRAAEQRRAMPPRMPVMAKRIDTQTRRQPQRQMPVAPRQPVPQSHQPLPSEAPTIVTRSAPIAPPAPAPRAPAVTAPALARWMKPNILRSQFIVTEILRRPVGMRDQSEQAGVKTMRIDAIEASNFKSLVDFKMPLAKFTCLIGLNGAGKSTVLHFIDFLGQLVRGRLEAWLRERNWRAKDVASGLTGKKNVDFSVSLINEEGRGGVTWKGSFNTSKLSCTTERIATPGAILEVDRGQLRIAEVDNGLQTKELLSEAISFEYQGSVLSQLKEDRLPSPLIGFRNYFTTITSLDLLSPELLRQRTREASGSLGLGGQRLSAFLYELGTAKRQRLTRDLKKAYAHLSLVHSSSLRSGWKQLEVVERFGDRVLRTEARHINDGMLRLIAILAELETDDRFLLFDEIENGVNPELIQFVIEKLLGARQQILVTSHSPMILNYLDDPIAREGVIYLYRTTEGFTKAIPFFSIPSMAEKLTVMGPGEAFVDTELTALAQEIADMNGRGA